jgi:hypothetical protein
MAVLVAQPGVAVKAAAGLATPLVDRNGLKELTSTTTSNLGAMTNRETKVTARRRPPAIPVQIIPSG